MKCFWKIAVSLAGGLALNAGLRAASPASAVSAKNPSPGNPYATVAVRNIFGLVAPAPPPDPAVDAEKNLPKITPTGIMGVFGHWQVLFKVAPTAKPGPPAKEEYYILSESQRQDDIEVIKIDEKNSLVTFDNHGFTQELPLANAPDSGGAASPPGAGNTGMPPGVPGAGGNSGPGGFTRFGAGSGGNNGGMPNSNPGSNGGGPNDANGGMNFGGSTQGHIYQPEASTMTKDDQTILIEAERATLMTSPNPPYSPAMLPPTELTKFNTTGGNENPAP